MTTRLTTCPVPSGPTQAPGQDSPTPPRAPVARRDRRAALPTRWSRRCRSGSRSRTGTCSAPAARDAPGDRRRPAARPFFAPRRAQTARSASASPTWPATGTGPGTDLADLLAPFAGAADHAASRRALQRLRHLVERTSPRTRTTPSTGSRATSPRHYDLSNELFAHVPRRDDDLLVGAGSTSARRRATGSSPPSCRKIDGDPRPGRRRRRHAGAGDRLRLGRAGDPRRRSAVPASPRSRCPREQPALARQRVDAAGVGRPVDVRLQDYREVDGHVRRDRQRRDDRGGRRGVLARRTSRRSTGCSRPAAGSASRRSPWPTTGCWPPGAATAGSTSTSSPAGMIPSMRAIDDNLRGAHRAARSSSAATSGRTTRGPCASGGSGSSSSGREAPAARLRRDLPPDVGVLPRLLRGRLPQSATSASASCGSPAPMRTA